MLLFDYSYFNIDVSQLLITNAYITLTLCYTVLYTLDAQ